jgi:hypothetical protein
MLSRVWYGTRGFVSVPKMRFSTRLDASELSILWRSATGIRTSLGGPMRLVSARMRKVRIEIRQPLYLLSTGNTGVQRLTWQWGPTRVNDPSTYAPINIPKIPYNSEWGR